MTGKRHAAVGNDAFRKRCRNHAGEFAVEAAVRCRTQAIKQGSGICGVRLTGLDGDRKGHVDDAQALVELPLIADDDDILRVWTVSQGVTQLWADTGGLAGGDYKWFGEGHSCQRLILDARLDESFVAQALHPQLRFFFHLAVANPAAQLRSFRSSVLS